MLRSFISKTMYCLLYVFPLLTLQAAVGQTNIKGRVVDEKGYPISGVSVIKEGIILSYSDVKGLFSVNTEPESILTFQCAGYFPYDLKLNGQNEVRVKMIADPLRKKVDIAFGKKERQFLTASVSTISGDELSDLHGGSLGNLLQGQLPGLTVMKTSGEPGADIPDLYIRGTGTYNDNSIIVFVDGFESTMAGLLPSEIESITVLKDAVALAPFGMRGANGVLWVTTKRGIKGRPRVSLKTRTGFSSAVRLPRFLDAYGYASLYNEAVSNDAGSWSPVYSQADLSAYKNGSDPLFHPNVNWYDEILRNAVQYNEANISVSGGSDRTKYYVLFGYRYSPKLFKKNNHDNTGQLKNTGSMTQYNLRANVDAELSRVVTASVTFGGVISDERNPTADMFDELAVTPPNVFLPKNPDGSWGGNAIYPDNPMADLMATGVNSAHSRSVNGIITLKENLYFITPGLSLNQAVNFSNWYNINYNTTRNYARFAPTISGDSIIYQQLENNTDYSVSENGREEWNRIGVDLSGNYFKNIGKNSFSAMLRYRLNKYTVSPGTSAVPYVHTGFSGRINYSYDETYLAQFSFGYNGSADFPKGRRFGFFPALSAGWIISNENFMDKPRWIDMLKLRASAGIVGNDMLGTDRFLYQQYYPNGSGYILGYDGNKKVSKIVEGREGNPDITWESSYQYNIGIDALFFHSKLAFSFDYFHDNRKDIVGQRSGSTPLYLGINLPYENFGKVVNRGFELNMVFRDTIGSFEYSVGGNASVVRNKIRYEDEVAHREKWSYRTGQPVGQPFGLVALGLFNSVDEINSSPVQVYGPVQPGDIRYKDQNKDGFINDDDKIPIGYGDVPQINYSLHLGAAFKGVEMDILLYGVSNRSIYLHGNEVWAFDNNGQAPAMAEGRWAYYPDQHIDTRQTAIYPRLSVQGSANNNRRSTFWTKNGSFLRLSNIELGYNLPARFLDRLKLAGVKIFISGTNLACWDKLKYFDPEVVTGYPLLKSYNLGIDLNF